MKNWIEVSHVSKSFKNQMVLNDVSLYCEPGKIYGIVGYNGSGKSVLFKCICGFYKVDQGTIRVRGKEIGEENSMIENAGIIIEEPAFLKQYSGLKNLEFLYGLNHKADRSYLYKVLADIGLAGSEHKPVGKYSLGMKQRLAIAQAIMEDQDILILDEPMNGLDRGGIEQMQKLFLQMKEQGKLLLFASHNREDIRILCDEVYEMDHGKLQLSKPSTSISL